MKKKAIEKVDYLGLPKVSPKKDVKFIGVTRLKNVAHERHLFLEIYRNEEDSKKVPVVRIVMTKKDFGTYFPETGTWSMANIENCCGLLIWTGSGTSYKERENKNILYDAEDFKRLKGFLGIKNHSNGINWWTYISNAQMKIVDKERNERRQRKYEKRQQALQDRLDHTPELPEQAILSWANEALFQKKHMLYYKKKGRRVTICCSACGGVKEGVWKPGITYESTFESRLDDPRDNASGICPLCGARGIYRAEGKMKSSYSEKAYIFKADRYKETGAVIRYIQIEKKWVIELAVEDKGYPVMIGAYEKLEGVELIREYIYKGKCQKDFQKHDPYADKDFWDDCNLYGMNSISAKAARLYPGFFENLKGTELQYSALDLYQAAVGEINAMTYMERYIEMPQIEMLVKMKLYGVVDKIIHCNCGIIRDQDAKSLDKFLGIRKEKVKWFMEKQGNTDILSVLQKEKWMDQKWTDEQVEALSEIKADVKDLERVTKIMTLQKALNQIAKYAGCDYGTGCSTAIERLYNTAGTYFDYLQMREQLGYDLKNTVYQRPRNLAKAHLKMVEEIDKEKADIRKQEAEEKYPLIRKNYRKLRNRLFYEDENFLIRPARSAEEIVMEGRTLHHCVGGDNYLQKHNNQESIILMLRDKKQPEIPYITVELKGEYIKQWHGAYNKKPEEENMQKWLDAYVTRLRCGRLGQAEAAWQDAAEQVRMPA